MSSNDSPAPSASEASVNTVDAGSTPGTSLTIDADKRRRRRRRASASASKKIPAADATPTSRLAVVEGTGADPAVIEVAPPRPRDRDAVDASLGEDGNGNDATTTATDATAAAQIISPRAAHAWLRQLASLSKSPAAPPAAAAAVAEEEEEDVPSAKTPGGGEFGGWVSAPPVSAPATEDAVATTPGFLRARSPATLARVIEAAATTPTPEPLADLSPVMAIEKKIESAGAESSSSPPERAAAAKAAANAMLASAVTLAPTPPWVLCAPPLTSPIASSPFPETSRRLCAMMTPRAVRIISLALSVALASSVVVALCVGVASGLGSSWSWGSSSETLDARAFHIDGASFIGAPGLVDVVRVVCALARVLARVVLGYGAAPAAPAADDGVSPAGLAILFGFVAVGAAAATTATATRLRDRCDACVSAIETVLAKMNAVEAVDALDADAATAAAAEEDANVSPFGVVAEMKRVMFPAGEHANASPSAVMLSRAKRMMRIAHKPASRAEGAQQT